MRTDRQHIQTGSCNTVLKEYYARYLQDVRKLSRSTVHHYWDALNNISRRLKDMGLVQDDIYEIGDLARLQEVREILFCDADFKALNSRGNQMYSAAFNNYFRFASGEDITKFKARADVLDMPVDVPPSHVSERQIVYRSGIIRLQVMEFAHYTCELHPEHRSFIAEKTHKPYMEGHHAISLHNQPAFSHSLDVYANIVCLCPVCHRQIHYGLIEDKTEMLRQNYHFRAERLAKSGLPVSENEFLELAMRQ